MVKKLKKIKPDKPNDKNIHKEIKKLLKDEMPMSFISAFFGFNKKVLKYVIKRWSLEENLIVPTLRSA